MPRTTAVPVTPAVLRWAIEQSGYKTDDLAHAIGVQASALEAWASGDTKPTLTEVRGDVAGARLETTFVMLPVWSVTAGLLKPADLAGYSNGQVYIQSMHVPLNRDAGEGCDAHVVRAAG